jgi:RHS repeat-associated protein
VTASTQQTGGQSYAFNYTYNAAGLLKTQSYVPSGRTITYGYDSAGRVSTVTGSVGGVPKTYVSSVGYAPHGGIEQVAYGNGLSESTSFNSRLQPACMTAGSLLTLKLKYTGGAGDPCAMTGADNNGNVRQATIVAGNATMTQEFTYDGVNRLEMASESGGWTQRYVYDGRGNRALLSGSGQYVPGQGLTPQVAQTTPETVAAIFPNNRWAGATHDSAGNQTALPLRTLTYDAENRVTQATLSGSTVGTYAYDGEGRRVTSTVGGNTTVFVYDAFGQLAAEHRTQAVAALCTTCYLTGDHLGSTRLVTDETGAVKERHDYLPFGEEIPAGIGARTVGMGYTSGEDVRQRFTGKERDAETGLDYFGARYFSGAQGRFSSPDPDNYDARLEQPQLWNMYAYTWNNPLRYRDDDGRAVNGLLALVGGGAGFVTSFAGSAISQQIEHGSVDWGTALKLGGVGAATGSLAGLTFGGSLVAQAVSSVAIGTAGNVIQGAASRAVTGGDALDTDALESDLGVGVVSSTIGAGLQFVGTVANLPIKPKVPTPLATVRNQLKRRAALQAWARQREQISNKSSAIGGVVSSTISNAGAQIVSAGENRQNYLTSLWFELVSRPRESQNGTTSTICYAGQPGCPAQGTQP